MKKTFYLFIVSGWLGGWLSQFHEFCCICKENSYGLNQWKKWTWVDWCTWAKTSKGTTRGRVGPWRDRQVAQQHWTRISIIPSLPMLRCENIYKIDKCHISIHTSHAKFIDVAQAFLTVALKISDTLCLRLTNVLKTHCSCDMLSKLKSKHHPPFVDNLMC